MSVMLPQGTFYMFINIKETGLTSKEVSQILLEEAPGMDSEDVERVISDWHAR